MTIRKLTTPIFIVLLTLVTLTACTSNTESEATFDPNAFSRANELLVDNRFIDFITMEIDVLAPEQHLIVTITNGSDYEINVGSGSEVRIASPLLQFFDGEVWRRIPTTHSFEPETYRLEDGIASGETKQISVDLERYAIANIPIESSFRIVLRARGNTSEEGNLTDFAFRHEFYTTFTLNEEAPMQPMYYDQFEFNRELSEYRLQSVLETAESWEIEIMINILESVGVRGVIDIEPISQSAGNLPTVPAIVIESEDNRHYLVHLEGNSIGTITNSDNEIIYMAFEPIIFE